MCLSEKGCYIAFAGLQKRQIAFTDYKDYIGMDITSLVTLPVWIMEPYTILQKVAEIMEYTELLDNAASTEDPYERSAHTVVQLELVVVGEQGPDLPILMLWTGQLPQGQTPEVQMIDKRQFAAACSCQILVPRLQNYPVSRTAAGRAHASDTVWRDESEADAVLSSPPLNLCTAGWRGWQASALGHLAAMSAHGSRSTPSWAKLLSWTSPQTASASWQSRCSLMPQKLSLASSLPDVLRGIS